EAIVTAVMNAARCWPVRVWGTDGTFHTTTEAKERWETVAAANWHALATYVGRFAPTHDALLIDIGSTTTDIIPLSSGVPHTWGKTDVERLNFAELVYTGVKRTPVCAVVNDRVCAELFADMRDVYLVLGMRPESAGTVDTSDGRPETIPFAQARLARMLGGDRSTIPEIDLVRFATRCHQRQRDMIRTGICDVLNGQQRPLDLRTVIQSGSGEFLAAQAWEQARPDASDVPVMSLTDRLGPAVAEGAPAFAVAVLAQERPL
ncbi:MAG: hydantoinase/oxoprolinase family protein, partial [Gemmataceae bacterium]